MIAALSIASCLFFGHPLPEELFELLDGNYMTSDRVLRFPLNVTAGDRQWLAHVNILVYDVLADEVSPVAKVSPDDPSLTLRVERCGFYWIWAQSVSRDGTKTPNDDDFESLASDPAFKLLVLPKIPDRAESRPK
jgi:hypothetical protein